MFNTEYKKEDGLYTVSSKTRTRSRHIFGSNQNTVINDEDKK